MNRILKTHMVSVALVTVILGVLFALALQGRQSSKTKTPPQLQEILQIEGLDWDNAFDRALLHDALDMFEPNQQAGNAALLQTLRDYRQKQAEQLTGHKALLAPLNGSRLLKLLTMYLRFIIIYVLVMLLTYYGVQSLTVWRFVLYRQRRAPYLQRLVELFKN